MLFQSIILILCLSLNSVYAVDSDTHEPEMAVNIITKSGLHVVFPYYPNVKTLDPELAKVTTEHSVKIVRYLQEILGGLLDNRQLAAFGYIAVANKLISMGRAAKKERKNLSLHLNSRGQFNKDISSMFKHMIKMSKHVEINVTNDNRSQLKADVNALLDGLVEALETSLVSQYFDWFNGTIEGLNFEFYTSRIMARLRKNGFSGIFGCVSTFLTWVVHKDTFG